MLQLPRASAESNERKRPAVSAAEDKQVSTRPAGTGSSGGGGGEALQAPADEAALATSLKLSLNLAQRVRRMEGALYDSIVLPPGDAVCKAI